MGWSLLGFVPFIVLSWWAHCLTKTQTDRLEILNAISHNCDYWSKEAEKNLAGAWSSTKHYQHNYIMKNWKRALKMHDEMRTVPFRKHLWQRLTFRRPLDIYPASLQQFLDWL